VSDFVDWRLAGRLAHLAAGAGPAAMAGRGDLEAVDARSRDAVLSYTGLELVERPPAAEWVSRREWVAANLASMRSLIGPLEGRLAESMPTGRAGRAAGAAAGGLVAAEVAGVLGLASRRVLGQFEFPLGGDGAPRLLLVGQNLDEAAGQMRVDAGDLLEWVTLHEVTHAVHFSAAPWLRGHLAGLAETLLTETPSQLSLGSAVDGARRLASDPRGTLAQLRDSDPVMLLAPPEARPTIASVQATMAIVEGFAEHVMDAAGGHLGGAVQELRLALERRRESRSNLARVLGWLLGFEMKLRQYRDGKRFTDAVVAAGGMGALNRAWDGPDALPTLGELASPGAWLARTGAGAAAA
jgi:coenzyme F420 biosynthesis associated uncharacterized protein